MARVGRGNGWRGGRSGGSWVVFPLHCRGWVLGREEGREVPPSLASSHPIEDRRGTVHSAHSPYPPAPCVCTHRTGVKRGELVLPAE